VKVLGIVGSPRKNGNSFYLIREALKAAKEAEPSLETEIIQLGDLDIDSCRACESCAEEPYKCVIEDDFEFVLNKMKDADGVLIASPRYGPFGACPSKMQALLERLVNVNHLPPQKNPEFVFPLKDKPCGLLAVSAEGRQNNLPVLHSLEQYVLVYRMRVIHTTEWPWIGVSGRGDEKGDVLNDNAAMKNAQQLGKLLIEDLKKKR
jgi:multimeric flavodoxin WrbA